MRVDAMHLSAQKGAPIKITRPSRIRTAKPTTTIEYFVRTFGLSL